MIMKQAGMPIVLRHLHVELQLTGGVLGVALQEGTLLQRMMSHASTSSGGVFSAAFGAIAGGHKRSTAHDRMRELPPPVKKPAATAAPDPLKVMLDAGSRTGHETTGTGPTFPIYSAAMCILRMLAEHDSGFASAMQTMRHRQEACPA